MSFAGGSAVNRQAALQRNLRRLNGESGEKLTCGFQSGLHEGDGCFTRHRAAIPCCSIRNWRVDGPPACL